ncbi:hypothetical protein OAZ06_04045 [Synechococcus sp. AH-736-G20]|nr:hypothetical protein [Synechococcus sp. AH-736-G20]
MTHIPSQSRSLLIDIADQLDYEQTFKELVRVMNQDQVEDFMTHLCEVADIEDLMPAKA